MLIDFFLKLKSHKLPVSIKEYLTLLEAMGKDVIGPSINEFYYLSRAALVKDETNYDKFDRAFGEFWQGVETIPGIETQISQLGTRMTGKTVFCQHGADTHFKKLCGFVLSFDGAACRERQRDCGCK